VFEASERPAEDPQPPLSAAAALADADVTTLDLDGTLDALATWQRAAACAEYGLLETAAHYADLCGQPPVAAPDKGRERAWFGSVVRHAAGGGVCLDRSRRSGWDVDGASNDADRGRTRSSTPAAGCLRGAAVR